MKAKRVSDEVAAMLDQVWCEDNMLSLEPLGKIERKAYLAIDAVLKEAGGKWVKKVGCHVFQSNAADIVDNLLLTREVISTKRAFQQYDTSIPVVKMLVDAAMIKPGLRTLEPSMGLGALAFEVHRRGAIVSGYEIDDERHYLVTHNMRRRYDDARFEGCIHGDFLSAEPDPSFDRVVMNPPFTRGQDIMHVSHALDFLKPRGRLVAVLSASAFERTTTAHNHFREKIKPHDFSVTPIPAGAFREAGTMVSTIMLVLQKD